MSNLTKISQYLTVLGVDSLSRDIFLSLCQLGPQPASVIARKIGIERTKTYRLLRILCEKGLLSSSQRHGTKTFFVSDLTGIEGLIDQRKKDTAYLEDNKKDIFESIRSIASTDLAVPSVRIFEGSEIEHLFHDIMTTIQTHGLKTIRLFASNSYEEQTRSGGLEQPVKQLLEHIRSKKIHIQSYIGTGSLIMERIEKENNLDTLLQLPTSDASTHVFVVGTVTYIVIYRDKPIGIRLDSAHFAHVLHLLLDNIITS